MNLYSIKMRASKDIDGRSVHISGAEKIVSENNIANCANTLIKRALNHENGRADFVNVKVEAIENDNILELKALPVTCRVVNSKEDGYLEIQKELEKIGVKSTQKIFERLKEVEPMRGAMLLDINTFERLEPKQDRGLRATYMDSDKYNLSSSKNHFREAIILATKVANAPHIVGEICISDDVNYTIGYFASIKSGYVRITKLKDVGDTFGGRIFLYNGKTQKDLEETIDFIENKPVIVTNVPELKTNTDKWEYLKKNIETLKENQLYRTQSVITNNANSDVQIADKNYKMFASNNYLGLANNDEIKEYAVKMLQEYGTGTGGSRLVCGNFDLHNQLEEKIANFKGCESAIVFNSGYCANVAVLSAMFKENDVIFSDELNHASIIDGCKLSKARTIIYKHNDLADLEEKINKISYEKGVIVSDAVFSMDGDIANLPEILRLAKKYNLFSYIDEAHSTGVLGKTGRGICEYYNLKEHPDILMGTLSKAIGSEGGYIAGKKLLTDYLRNTARSYIFSTSISAAPIAAAIKSFELLQKDNSYVENLHENINYFNKLLQENGIDVVSKTPIFSIIIGDEEKAMRVAEYLMDKKFFIKAIRYPTVAKGQARLRIALNATHSKDDMKELVKILSEVIK
ncbi:8-amino-7-oxononanoate synthase [bacterium]|nr:8-amino-7-oxononanoate synthase [bacterium]